MKKIAQFHKVSFGQFLESWQDTFEGTSEDEVRQIFDGIELPRRATRGSAGYDFYSPVDFELKPGETIKIPTVQFSGDTFGQFAGQLGALGECDAANRDQRQHVGSPHACRCI